MSVCRWTETENITAVFTWNVICLLPPPFRKEAMTCIWKVFTSSSLFYDLFSMAHGHKTLWFSYCTQIQMWIDIHFVFCICVYIADVRKLNPQQALFVMGKASSDLLKKKNKAPVNDCWICVSFFSFTLYNFHKTNVCIRCNSIKKPPRKHNSFIGITQTSSGCAFTFARNAAFS